MTNARLENLQLYPFDRLGTLLSGAKPATSLAPISLSIGEPQHAVPDFVHGVLSESVGLLGKYPPTAGSAELREIIAQWIIQRYNLNRDAISPTTQVITASGTRESLFGIAQCVVDASAVSSHPAGKPFVMMPNPGYQIYEGAALLSGAQPYYLPTTAEHDFLPDYQAIPEADWANTQLLYYCSPGNPIGSFHDKETIAFLLDKAEEHDFVIVADECYSEIYSDPDVSPPGLLCTAIEKGNAGFQRCISMNSLSKRSNLPGLRSGFIAGDAALIAQFIKLRSYQGNAMSLASQAVSARAWSESAHVTDNQHLYREKFRCAQQVLNAVPDWYFPEGGFFLWLPTIGSDTTFARALYEQQSLTVLPGQYLGRAQSGTMPAKNPGEGFIRVALVDNLDMIQVALERLNQFYQTYSPIEHEQ